MLFLKSTIIKIEFYGTIRDIDNIIKKIIEYICIKNNKFKVSLEKLIELRKQYIYNKNMNNSLIRDYYSQIDDSKKINFELFFSNSYECLGLQEYCLKMKYITSGIVESNKATFFEIKKDDLFKIFQTESEILPDYYKLVYLKLLSLIKRFHNLRNAIINKELYKAKENSINFIDTQNDIISYNNKSTINMSLKGEILNPQKLKNTLNEKYSYLDITRIRDLFPKK
jgi:predicted AlkP superfamily pyrophosphatase or phosphodiesterase